MARTLWLMVAACVLLGTSVVMASESDELRERAVDLKRKAAELMERGEKPTAQRLLQEAAQLYERAQILERNEKVARTRKQPEQPERELQRLHARLKQLQIAHRELWAADAPDEELVDLRFHIQKIETLIADKEGPSSSQDRLHQLERQLQRIEHMRHAAEHLQAAEMPEIAQNLREKSAQMERAAREMLEHLEQQADEVSRPSAPFPDAPAPQPPSSPKAAEQALREEVQALRREVEKLREQRRP
jgi:hypothetical protein